MTFRPPPRPQLVAHKGNSWEHPENTRASVVSAIEAGADVVEIDVCTTADGVVAVIHGPTLQASTTGNGKIAETEWADIAGLRARFRDGTPTDETVPRLDELLTDLGHRAIWNIDLKDDRAIDPVVDLINDLGISKKVVLTGSRLRRVRRVLETGQNVAVLVDLTRLDQLFALWPTTRRWWLCRRYHHVLQDDLVVGLNLAARYVDATMVACVHDSGAEIWTFTVDDQERVDFLLALGVDSVTTNRPGAITVRRLPT
jgi:glycerophosphoryl diester phosphodiesterase